MTIVTVSVVNVVLVVDLCATHDDRMRGRVGNVIILNPSSVFVLSVYLVLLIDWYDTYVLSRPLPAFVSVPVLSTCYALPSCLYFIVTVPPSLSAIFPLLLFSIYLLFSTYKCLLLFSPLSFLLPTPFLSPHTYCLAFLFRIHITFPPSVLPHTHSGCAWSLLTRWFLND